MLVLWLVSVLMTLLVCPTVDPASQTLPVVLTSGSRIGFTGSAPSLIGTITRYCSARRMIDRIQDVVGRPLTTGTSWQPEDRPVARRLRTTALLWCGAYVVGGSAGALAIAASLR